MKAKTYITRIVTHWNKKKDIDTSLGNFKFEDFRLYDKGSFDFVFFVNDCKLKNFWPREYGVLLLPVSLRQMIVAVRKKVPHIPHAFIHKC